MKITVTVPEKHLNNTDITDHLDALLKLAGGVTSTEVTGLWLDEHGAVHIDESVQLTWLTRRSKTDEVEFRAQVDQLIAALHVAGEQEVLVESTHTVVWFNVKKGEVFFGY